MATTELDIGSTRRAATAAAAQLAVVRRSQAGEWVEVRSKEEILATLDKEGRLEGLPFMPEMFAFCGKRYRVQARAHKACDTINPVSSRSLPGGVLLEGLRCDGAAHGGCQALCSIFWKEAWLKPIESDEPEAGSPAARGCTEADVVAAARAGETPKGAPIYRCQATDFPQYTTLLRTKNVAQYAEDLASKNVSLLDMIFNAPYFAFDLVAPADRKRSVPFHALYDGFAKVFGFTPYPRRPGLVEDSSSIPENALGLKAGDLVRVKSYEEILALLGKDHKHKGLWFDAEMVPFCGGVFRVRASVEHFLDERTGVMRHMKTPAVILEGVWCKSKFSNKRIACPRAIYAWWREAWLERAPEGAEVSTEACLGKHIVPKIIDERNA